MNIESIPASMLRVDPSIQREVEEPQVRYLVREWSDVSCGVLTGSRRDDGIVYLVDGQQRMTAKMRTDPNYVFTVQVHVGLSITEEANLFVAMNKNRKAVAAFYVYRSEILNGDKSALAIQKAVTSVDAIVAPRNGGIKRVTCISSMKRVVARNLGPDALKFALRVYKNAWGSGAFPMWRGEMVEALGAMFSTYGGSINEHTFTEKLKKKDPIALLGIAKARAIGSNRAVPQLRDVLIEVYNVGRKSGTRLGEGTVAA
jgi:hypothetical protein